MTTHRARGERRPLTQVPVLLERPLVEQLDAARPFIVASEHLRGDIALVRVARERAMQEEGEDDMFVAISSSEVERRCARASHDECGGISMSVARVFKGMPG